MSPGYVSTPTAEIMTAKILFNSILSTKQAQFMVIDIKKSYLNTPMERYKDIRIPLKLIPEEIVKQYSL